MGIGESTYYEWRERGQREIERLDLEGLDCQFLAQKACSGNSAEVLQQCPEHFDPDEWAFVVFKLQTERARARSEVNALKLVKNAADTSWRAAAWWYLERASGALLTTAAHFASYPGAR